MILIALALVIIAYKRGVHNGAKLASQHEETRIKFAVEYALWAKEEEAKTYLLEEWERNIVRDDIPVSKG